MKRVQEFAVLAMLLFAAGMMIDAQENPSDRAVVNFSNPAKPGTVEVSLPGGSITVRGYEGKEVIVEARWREKLLTEEGREPAETPEPEEEMDEEQKAQEKARAEKSKGMKMFEVETTGLAVEEEENVIRVEVQSYKRAADLTIQVPYSTSLQLSCEGQISVERVDGEIEVNSSHGPINLMNVSGPVVADSPDGEIKAVFGKINPAKPMSLSTMERDIDITLPFDAKVSLKLKSEGGKIYTDFDLKMTPSQQKKEEDERKEGGRFRVAFEKTSLGLINGGGVEIQLTSYEGDIYIRKAK